LKLDKEDMDAFLEMVEDTKDQALDNPEEEELMSGKRLTKKFVDRFDAVMIMHVPIWIVVNWEAMKHKPVIWRTIGQSITNNELSLKKFRDQGLNIVRYSPMEENIPVNNGLDALIRFYKDPNDFYKWTGSSGEAINLCQSMRKREAHCNIDLFEEAAKDLPVKLYGPGNETSPFNGGILTYEEVKRTMADARVYFYTGTQPASYTLNFMEAAMSGVPFVVIGETHGNSIFNINLYEVGKIVREFNCGYVSDDAQELHNYIEKLLKDDDLAKEFSHNSRQMALDLFDKEKIKVQWESYFKTIE
jgi:glycosyltransferase involved in cell wall biosynthesis